MSGACNACVRVVAIGEQSDDGAVLDEVYTAGAFQASTMEVCDAVCCIKAVVRAAHVEDFIFSWHQLASSGLRRVWRRGPLGLRWVV